MYEYDPRNSGLEFQSDRTSPAGVLAAAPRAWGNDSGSGGGTLAVSPVPRAEAETPIEVSNSSLSDDCCHEGSWVAVRSRERSARATSPAGVAVSSALAEGPVSHE